jgi:hypothetical protein
MAEGRAWSEFDELREWNAQAGRLATLASISVAGLVFFDFRGEIAARQADATSGDVLAVTQFIGLVLVPVLLILALFSVITALEDAVPEAPAPTARTILAAALARKRRRCRLAVRLIEGAILLTILVWISETPGVWVYVFGLGFLVAGRAMYLRVRRPARERIGINWPLGRPAAGTERPEPTADSPAR